MCLTILLCTHFSGDFLILDFMEIKLLKLTKSRKATLEVSKLRHLYDEVHLLIWWVIFIKTLPCQNFAYAMFYLSHTHTMVLGRMEEKPYPHIIENSTLLFYFFFLLSFFLYHFYLVIP